MRRTLFIVALVLSVATTVAWPRAEQAGGRGAGAAPAPVKHPNGTLTPMALDPGRPWGWAVKAHDGAPLRLHVV